MDTIPKIFVLDDDEHHLNWLVNTFAARFQVRKYQQGADLLAAVGADTKDEYKAVVVDLELRGQRISGSQVCHEIKKIKPYLPVVAITASTDPQYIANALFRRGFDDFIPKSAVGPTPETCIATVAHVMEGVERYPQIVSLWRSMTSLNLDDFEFVVRASFRSELDYRLKKSYFYILLSDALPLLDALLLRENAPCAESIIQSAAAIETILNYEDRLWRQEIIDRGSLGPRSILPSERSIKVDRLMDNALIEAQFKSKVMTVFEHRDKWAHGGRNIDSASKEQALSDLETALAVVRSYLGSKKRSTFPNS